ncbi:MAG: TIGR02391 family protein [Candidatus Nanopelagicaceae bacterium]|nr:TIGR02391 family protein [Candidatus Nanopelagicaceae bacterium]
MSSSIETVLEKSKQVKLACAAIERSWSGSFAGWHGSMYFRNFDTPNVDQRFSGDWGNIYGIPDGWVVRQPEEVQVAIEALIGEDFSAEEFEEEVNLLKKNAAQLHEDIVDLLSTVDLSRVTGNAIVLVDEVNDYSFGEAKTAAIRAHFSRTLVSRDTEALRQGIYTPPWLYFEVVAADCVAVCNEIREFIHVVNRMVRLLNSAREPSDVRVVMDRVTLISLHPEIYAKCDALFEHGAFPEAVEKGFKIVRDRLRGLTGHETGSEAFGKGKLHVKGASAPNVANDFNEAVKFLTMAIDQFRNEKAHTSNAKVEAQRAYEYLTLSSLAMNLLENAEAREIAVDPGADA